MTTSILDPYSYTLTSALDPPDLMLWMSGEMDFSTENGLEAFGETDLADVHSIMLDLSALGFIDAAGVRALRAWHDDHTEHARVVSMVSAQSPVRRMFKLLDSEDYLAAAA